MKQNRKSYFTIQKVQNYIKDNDLITAGSMVFIGLSGGADSVCLIDILSQLRNELKFELKAIHVHHGIREESADNDAKFCENLCRDLGIELILKYVDIPAEAKKTGESIEECARRIRYEIFNEEAKKAKDARIAVAHHINDQAETVIFRMIRGTGIKGIRGMLPANGIVIRPLLCMTREEILDYLDFLHMDYCIDETNYDTDYSRNLIRQNILSDAKKICPEAAVHISQLAEDAAQIEEYLEKKAKNLYEKALIGSGDSKVILRADVIASEDSIISRMAIKIAIEQVTKSLKDITRDHVESILKIIGSSEASCVNLPKKLVVKKENNELSFEKADAEGCTEGLIEGYTEDKTVIILSVPGMVTLPDGRILSAKLEGINDCGDIPRNLYTKWFDYDKIKPGLCVRTRQNGDYFIASSSGSHKSLSRYLIDEKIPKSKRDEILVLAAGNQVYWIIGYRISESVKIDKGTTQVVKFDIKGEES